MNYTRLPKRRTRPKMGLRESSVIRCESHLRWIRGFDCILANHPGHVCKGKVRACHYRLDGNGGIGLKPGDDRTWPGCDGSHEEQHRIGEPAFEAKYKLNLAELVARLWQESPHGVAYRMKHKANGEWIRRD